MNAANPMSEGREEGHRARFRLGAIAALRIAASVLAFVLVHEFGLSQARKADVEGVDAAAAALQRSLDSASLGIQTVGRLPVAGEADIGPTAWYQVSRDHPGLLAAARLADGAASRLRLLSPQTPVWMNRVLLQADEAFVARAALGQSPEVDPIALPPEAPAGHRLLRLGIGEPAAAASGGPPAASTITIFLVDATELIAAAVTATPLTADRLSVSDEAGTVLDRKHWTFGESPIAFDLRFSGTIWTARYALPWRPVSVWDGLGLLLVLSGCGYAVIGVQRAGFGRGGQSKATLADEAPSGFAPLADAPPPAAPEPPGDVRSITPSLDIASVRCGPAVATPAETDADPDLVDSPVEGAIEFVESGRLLRANDAAARMLGYRNGAEFELDAGSMDRVFADASEYQGMLSAIRGAGGVANFEADLLRQDRTRLPAALAAWPVRDGSGRIGKVVAYLRDNSARRESERRLMLEREAAEARSRAKSDFIANMSHELRTPLNAILGFSEIMTAQMFGPIGSDRYRQYAEDIHASGRHLLDLVNDVLDLSKIESSRFELSEEPLDLVPTARELVRLMENRAAEGGVSLGLEIPPGFPRLRADSRLIRQLLLNLLSNAVKFTLPGGEVVLLGQLDAGNGMVLAVRDSGVGMRPEDIPRALEPFGQVGDGAIRQKEGTGLGLPLAKSIAEAHGGTLAVDSVPGKGTTVSVRLPAFRVLPQEGPPA